MELNEYLALQNKRKRPHKQEETGIQIALVNWLFVNHPHVLFTSALGGIKTTIGQAVKLKRMGYRRGFPDLLIFEARGIYHGLLIELKTKTGVLSPFQKEIAHLLMQRDYRVATCFGFDQAVYYITKYLVLKSGEAIDG